MLRHSVRADKEGEAWADAETRTWDPPLSEAKGWAVAAEQVDTIARLLRSHGLTTVWSSPYVRCLQTAGVLLRRLGLPWTALRVNLGLGEAFDYWNTLRYVSNVDAADVREEDGTYSGLKRWFWKHKAAAPDGRVRLQGRTSLQRQFEKYVLPRRGGGGPKVPVHGRFAEFEGLVRLLPGAAPKTYARYAQAASQVLTHQAGRSGAIVTHQAGFLALRQHLTGAASRGSIKLAAFCVLVRDDAKSPWRIVAEDV